MPINYTNKILIAGNDMSEGNTFNQTNEAGSMGTQGQQGDAVAGDKIDGDVDKSQGKTEIAGDMTGNIENTNIQGGQVSFSEKFKELIDEMTKEADAAGAPAYEPPTEPREIPADEPQIEEFDEAAYEDFEPVEVTDNSDHPQAVFAAMSSAPPTTEEEKTGFLNRMVSSVKKYAQSDTAKGLASTAAGLVEIAADVGMPWQAKAAIFVLKKFAGN